MKQFLDKLKNDFKNRSKELEKFNRQCEQKFCTKGGINCWTVVDQLVMGELLKGFSGSFVTEDMRLGAWHMGVYYQLRNHLMGQNNRQPRLMRALRMSFTDEEVAWLHSYGRFE